MAKFFALDGLEIRVDDALIELSVSGERLPDSADQAGKMLALMMRSNPVEALMVDLRDAFYPLTEVELGERAALMSRQSAGLPVGFVTRPDQATELEVFLAASAQHDSPARGFRFVSEARDWLRGEMAARRALETGS